MNRFFDRTPARLTRFLPSFVLVLGLTGLATLSACSVEQTRSSLERLGEKVQETGQHLSAAAEKAQQDGIGAASADLQRAATSTKEAAVEVGTMVIDTASGAKEKFDELAAQP